MPRIIREAAILTAQKRMPGAALGYWSTIGVQTAKAVIVWPEGKENWSGGNSLDQQCGSTAQGRRRPVARFKPRKRTIPTPAAKPDSATTSIPCAPPKTSKDAPSTYHSQPSPPRVAQIIHSRIHLGAGHFCTLRISE